MGSCSAAVCNPTLSTSTNRITSSGYTYDANGAVTQDASGQRFGYDAESRQKEFFAAVNSGGTPDATYSYDGEARRVKKVAGTETTIFVYDASSQMVAEYSTVSATLQQVSYLTTDHLGSPRIITNENGAVTSRKDFMAFGDEATSSQRVGGPTGNGYDPPNVRQDYTGYQNDEESGLEYAQARFYNSGHGRFTSVDPLTASASIKNPQTFNRYSYVLNSPYKFTDPLGLMAYDAMWHCSGCESYGGVGGAFSSAAAGGGASYSLFDMLNGLTVELRIFLAVPEGGLSGKQEATARGEVSSIYKQAGVGVVFSQNDVDFTVSIVEKAASQPRADKNAVGYTPLSEDGKRVLSTGYVFKDRAKEAARDADGSGQAQTLYDRDPDTNLALAVGRAAAHEIGHYLLQQTHDDPLINGVMNAGGRGAKWFTNENSAKWWSFSPKQQKAMHSFINELIQTRSNYYKQFKVDP
ncbi:MAG TPA: RHS repeat-associated core domain-containing protein [Pyrinomonadaceae bacterium]|nr:RHS repeat-associated core domain-containing protein [Pyrinomonadaceae bacterium]